MSNWGNIYGDSDGTRAAKGRKYMLLLLQSTQIVRQTGNA
jgi:hypothetical protein